VLCGVMVVFVHAQLLYDPQSRGGYEQRQAVSIEPNDYDFEPMSNFQFQFCKSLVRPPVVKVG
jgi:hypothetical protein